MKLILLSLNLVFIFTVSTTHANVHCSAIFKQSYSVDLSKAEQKTDVQDLESLGKAMTEGMILHPEQADIFGVYLQVFFGDPRTNLGGKNLTSVIEILKEHPELTKMPFPEFKINAVEKVYSTPESLAKFVKSQIETGAQVRNNLFQIEANLNFWKKVLDYKDIDIPEGLKPLNLGRNSTEQERAKARAINVARAEFQDKSQKRFVKYLDRIISKTNRDLLADLKNEQTPYDQKAKALFETLRTVEAWMTQKGRDTQAIRQAMVDLVFTVGYGNQSTIDLLKSPNGSDKIQGLNQLWNEADSFAEVLNYPGHFAELKTKLNINFPTGLSKNEDLVKIIQALKKEVLSSPYTTKPADEMRVRSLSIQESPFRSCLGADCSTRTYFEMALDPNYIYFTMTDSAHKSSGQATIVLGTVTNMHTGQQELVAFLDKLQNIPTQRIELFLTAVNKSLQENGYHLGIPTDLGKHITGHGGLSNMDIITDFVQINIMPRLNEVRNEFTPHEHQYQFPNRYSRGNQKLEVRLFKPKSVETDFEIYPGKQYTPYLAEKSLDKKLLARDFLKMRESNKEVDQIKFIKSWSLVNHFETLGIYRQSDFINDLKLVLNKKEFSLNVRKNALYELLVRDVSHFKLLQEKFTNIEIQQIISELGQWKKSNDSRKKNFIDNMEEVFFSFVKQKNSDQVKLLLKMGIDGNSTLIRISGQKKYLIMGYTEEIKFLLDKPGIDINAKNKQGITALMEASKRNNKDVIELLLKIPGIDVNAKANNGDTALIEAAVRGNKDVVKLLLNTSSINVNAKGSYGSTALINAASLNYKDIVELLLKTKGVDVNAKNEFGSTALSEASVRGHNDVVKLLVSYGVQR